ncbi:MAG: hypothetical protein GEU90_14835 [Gemmatimonas sp.]|nr:hypothetical protein [Gemmatimonas sp.]
MPRKDANPENSGDSADPTGRLYHDLRSALGGVCLSLESLKDLEAEEEENPFSRRRARIISRALESALEAGRIANLLETQQRGDGEDAASQPSP